MGGNKQPSQTTQTTSTQPWAGQQPFLTDLFARAQGASQTIPQYFPGQTVAPQSAATLEGQRETMGVAQGLKPAANAFLDSAMFNVGAGRDPAQNPYLQNAIQAAVNPLMQNFSSVGGPLSQIRSGFTANNSGGSGTREGIAQGVAQRGLQQQVGDISSTMAFNAYQQGQDQSLRTLALAPSIMQTAATPASMISGVGGQQDAYNQMLINAAIERHNFQQTAPWIPLQNYGQLVAGGNFGSQGTTTTTAPGTRTNPFLTAGGGALSGYALSQMIPAMGVTGPVGAGVGAGLALLSML